MTEHLACRQKAGSGRWYAAIEEIQISITVRYLHLLCLTSKRLQKEKYVIDKLSERQILEKLRCENCAKLVRPSTYDARPDGSSRKYRGNDDCTYHPGKVANGVWSCCGARIFLPKDPGCYFADGHTIRHDYHVFLQDNWLFHSTASVPALSVQEPNIHRAFGQTLQNINGSNDFRMAIVMDCEFGSNNYNESELIRLTAIDFLSKEVLIDSLVCPTGISMKHYNTKYSGVRKGDIDRARHDNTCFMGRDSARKALLRYLGSDTVLIVHGGSGDLTSLRLIHPLIIDTFTLDSMLFDCAEGGRSLKNLCKKVMGIDIQTGRFGHDSVEDAFACRELLLCQLANLPEDFVTKLIALDDEEVSDAKVEVKHDDTLNKLDKGAEAVAILRAHADALVALAGIKNIKLNNGR